MEASAVRSSECTMGKKTFATAAAFQAKTCSKAEPGGSFGVPCMSCFVLLDISNFIRWHDKDC